MTLGPSVRAVSNRAGWALLGTLLGALLVGTATFDRSAWPSLVGDEATYLMQAESLAWDRDLVYSRTDFDRFVEHWGGPPEGLILQKGRDSSALVYGKPFYFAAWTAPFVRASPTRGPFVANALLLALAATVAAGALRRHLGSAAPLWVAVFVFASVLFAHAFWAHSDLFLACCTALGLALAFGSPRESREGGGNPRRRLAAGARWLAAGGLLAMVAYSRPLYAPLFLPVVLAALRLPRAPASHRVIALFGLAAGALAVVLVTLAVHQSLAGTWTSYGAERRSFNSAVGFPEVDLDPGAWDEMIREWGNASWLKRRDLAGISLGSPGLWAWNGLYFLTGRWVGVLPYFLPLVLGLLGRPRGTPRWALAAAVALTVVGLFLLRPFNFYGGGASLGNRYFLPVYPALWFLATRPVRLPAVLAVALVAAPFLWPLWTAPRAYPLDPSGVFRYASATAQRILPFETTQHHLKPGGPQPDVNHRGLWIKPLSPAVSVASGPDVLHLEGEGVGRLLVGRGRPLDTLVLEIGAGALPLEVSGARVVSEGPGAPGWARLRLELDGPRAVHPMWWTAEDFFLYRLVLYPREDPERSYPFTLTPGEATGDGFPFRHRGLANVGAGGA